MNIITTINAECQPPVILTVDEVQAIALALWKLRLDRPGWETYLHEISDKIAPGHFADYERMHVDGVTAALTGQHFIDHPDGGK